jgi:hypothetical protein
MIVYWLYTSIDGDPADWLLVERDTSTKMEREVAGSDGKELVNDWTSWDNDTITKERQQYRYNTIKKVSKEDAILFAI